MSQKRPLNLSNTPKTKKARKVITLNVKLEVLKRFEAGEKLCEIANTMGLATSTIVTIRENKDKIKAQSEAASPLSMTRLARSRSAVMEKMEKLLIVWIEDKHQHNLPVNSISIREKAKCLFDDLNRGEEIGKNCQKETFVASKGWYENFKRRHRLHLKSSNEAPPVDAASVEEYSEFLTSVIKEGGYTPQQVFNLAETRLYWKRLPDKMYIFEKGTDATIFKVSKKRLTLLLGSNASGDFKVTPLLVSHYESDNENTKSDLPIVWRTNEKAVITKAVFKDWFKNVFCASVSKYCVDKRLQNKVLIILDSNYQFEPADRPESLRVEYLAHNAATSLQPMHQDVFSTFKALYLRNTFRNFPDFIIGSNEGKCGLIQKFEQQFSFENALNCVSKSWEELQPGALNQAWGEVWPESVREDPEVETTEEIHQSIIQLATILGFDDITDSDVVDFVESHGQGLSNEELFQLEQKDDPTVDKPETARQLTTEQLSVALLYFEIGLQILTNNDPCEERSYKVAREVNESIHCYKQLYKNRGEESKQICLDNLFQKIRDATFTDENYFPLTSFSKN